ncbi:MAG: polysaccharide biosynthesis tyrosine autokinase [Bacteroidales bacterium]|nr:polysaccharide biosynthesis tyrosine autokinase [Bacteroidales bacterium]
MNEDLRNLNEISQQQEETIDFKALFFKIINNWYLFVITVFIALAVAFLFNKYSKTVYEVSTTVLVQDEQGSISTQELIGLNLSGDKQNLENEIGILKSFAVANRAVKAMNLEVSYFSENNFIVQELYQHPPFKVVFDKSHPQAPGIPFSIKILNKDQFQLEVEANEFSTYSYSSEKRIEVVKKSIAYEKKHSFGEWIETPYFRFKITSFDKENFEELQTKSLFFKFNNLSELTKRLSQFTIEPINREASILRLSIKGENKQKSVDFLNKLTEVYMDRGLEKKNQIATKTIEFIDDQLIDIKDSLEKAETKLQEFRLKNDVMNIEFQAEQLFEHMRELQNQKAQLMVKSKYYQYLKEYVTKNQSEKLDEIIVPSSMGIEDPVLAELIKRLTELYSEKARLSFSTKKDNVLTGQIDAKIRLTKETILENVNSIINTSEIAIKDINNRIAEISAKGDQLPMNQRKLFNIERQFKLFDNIYTFLMEKRSDAQITKASNLPDNEIVDKARVEAAEEVFPKTTLNFLIALLLGLLLPMGYIFGKDYFNDTITERKELEDALPDIPMLGHILHNDKDTNLVVHKSPKSSVSESFRSVRTNLEFITKSRGKAVISITSVIPGEGKTFIAENLALSYASFGKKTILLGFDMRKPKIYQDFGVNNLKGLSSYITGKDKLEDVIQKTSLENLDLIMAGPVPPNPAEIIASDETGELFKKLKETYDYIIIDTPPVGLSDGCLAVIQSRGCQCLCCPPGLLQ